MRSTNYVYNGFRAYPKQRSNNLTFSMFGTMMFLIPFIWFSPRVSSVFFQHWFYNYRLLQYRFYRYWFLFINSNHSGAFIVPISQFIAIVTIFIIVDFICTDFYHYWFYSYQLHNLSLFQSITRQIITCIRICTRPTYTISICVCVCVYILNCISINYWLFSSQFIRFHRCIILTLYTLITDTGLPITLTWY